MIELKPPFKVLCTKPWQWLEVVRAFPEYEGGQKLCDKWIHEFDKFPHICCGEYHPGAIYWARSDDCHSRMNGMVISFYDLFPASNLAKALGVMDDRAFEWRGNRYRVRGPGVPEDPTLHRYYKKEEGWLPAFDWIPMIIAHPDEITFPIAPEYSNETIEIAKALKVLGYKWVFRYRDSGLGASTGEPQIEICWGGFSFSAHSRQTAFDHEKCPEITWNNSPVAVDNILRCTQ